MLNQKIKRLSLAYFPIIEQYKNSRLLTTQIGMYQTQATMQGICCWFECLSTINILKEKTNLQKKRENAMSLERVVHRIDSFFLWFISSLHDVVYLRSRNIFVYFFNYRKIIDIFLIVWIIINRKNIHWLDFERRQENDLPNVIELIFSFM